MSAFPYTPGMAGLYTFKSTYDEIVYGAVREGNTLWVPRETAPYAPPPNDFRTTYPPVYLPITFTPRHEQKVLCERSIKLLQQGKNHIFEAPTGHGKTVEGGYIAARLGQPTMIVVSKDDLVGQWHHSLVHILGIPEAQIGHVQGEICDWKGKQFVIGMIQSLMVPGKYPQEMFKAFGLLILDEVHSMAAECFIRSCQLFPAKMRLGFSATPTRKDGKTKLLQWHIGPILVQGTVQAMVPKVLLRQTGWRIPTRRKLVGNAWVQEKIPYLPGRMTLVAKAMASSDTRNMEIVNFVLQAYKAGRRILVMSDLRDSHLHRLFQMLTGEGIPGNEIGYYVGGMKKHELQATKTRRVILGTYKMCSTGTDVPAWDSLVMATPRVDIRQAVGRVLRSATGKKQPVILDLVDYDAIFQGFHLARRKQYAEMGASLVKM